MILFDKIVILFLVTVIVGFCKSDKKENKAALEDWTVRNSISSSLNYFFKGVVSKFLRHYDDEKENPFVKLAHEGDTIDCVKRLICEFQKSNDANLDWDEKIIKNFVKRQIDFSVPHAQFHFAADIGRRQ